MATYRFQNINGGSDIVDAVIVVRRDLNAFRPDALTVDVTVDFNITDSNGNTSIFGYLLYNIPIAVCAYDYDEIVTNSMTALEPFLQD